MNNILDNLDQIKKLDSQNMLGSLESLGRQIEQVASDAKTLKLSKNYKNVRNIIFLGMGGSTLGSHVIKNLYASVLKVPVEIVNGYRTPNFIGSNSLVIGSSYSGSTEEPLFALREAKARKAKILVITSGGQMQAWAKKNKVPALIFGTQNNPCGSPRMGLGYTIAGQMILLAKAGLISFNAAEQRAFISAIDKFQISFGAETRAEQNFAKQLAESARGKSVWYVAAEHLAGNAHIGANQMNENAKRFGGYFIVPELNHHLMEGVMNPKSNRDCLLFVFLDSDLYDLRIGKRISITKEILQRNGIKFVSYQSSEKTKLSQAAETLLFTGYASFYGAMLEGTDPTAIPFVDYFKQQLKK